MKRNSIDDATHYYGDSKYYLTDSEFYQYSENKWVNIDEHVDGMTFKKINKEVKMKEYLVKNMYGDYVLTDHHSGFSVEDLIEVPEGAEIAVISKDGKVTFYREGGNYQYDNAWFKCGVIVGGNTVYCNLKSLLNLSGEYKIIWKRNPVTPNNIQNKLKFIEKWLNGEKIQYILGIETDKTQEDESKWHNLTEGAMQYIKLLIS